MATDTDQIDTFEQLLEEVFGESVGTDPTTRRAVSTGIADISEERGIGVGLTQVATLMLYQWMRDNPGYTLREIREAASIEDFNRQLDDIIALQILRAQIDDAQNSGVLSSAEETQLQAIEEQHNELLASIEERSPSAFVVADDILTLQNTRSEEVGDSISYFLSGDEQEQLAQTGTTAQQFIDAISTAALGLSSAELDVLYSSGGDILSRFVESGAGSFDIWFENQFQPQIKTFVNEALPLQEIDPVIDAEITRLLGTDIDFELDSHLRNAIKDRLLQELRRNPSMNKKEMYDLVRDSGGWEDTIDRAIEELVLGDDGGYEFILATRGLGISFSDIILNSNIDTARGIRGFLNTLYGTVEGLNSNIPIPVANNTGVNGVRFLRQEYGSALFELPTYIVNRVIQELDGQLKSNGLDPNNIADRDEIVSLFQGRVFGDLVNEVLRTEILRLEGGDRLVQQLNNAQISFSSAFKQLRIDNSIITQEVFAEAIGTKIIDIPALDTVEGRAGSFVGSLVGNLNETLQALAFTATDRLLAEMQRANPNLTLEDILNDADFRERLRATAETAVSARIEQIGGVLAEIEPDLQTLNEFFGANEDLRDLSLEELNDRILRGEIESDRVSQLGNEDETTRIINAAIEDEKRRKRLEDIQQGAEERVVEDEDTGFADQMREAERQRQVERLAEETFTREGLRRIREFLGPGISASDVLAAAPEELFAGFQERFNRLQGVTEITDEVRSTLAQAGEGAILEPDLTGIKDLDEVARLRQEAQTRGLTRFREISLNRFFEDRFTPRSTLGFSREARRQRVSPTGLPPVRGLLTVRRGGRF